MKQNLKNTSIYLGIVFTFTTFICAKSLKHKHSGFINVHDYPNTFELFFILLTGKLGRVSVIESLMLINTSINPKTSFLYNSILHLSITFAGCLSLILVFHGWDLAAVLGSQWMHDLFIDSGLPFSPLEALRSVAHCWYSTFLGWSACWAVALRCRRWESPVWPTWWGQWWTHKPCRSSQLFPVKYHVEWI